MNEQRMQAEELDAYLAGRQAGKQLLRPPALPADETGLLEELLALSRANQPDPGFTAGLEARLRAAAQRLPSLQRRTYHTTERVLMRKRVIFPIGRSLSAAAAAALVIVLVVAVVWLSQRGSPAGPKGPAQLAAATATATVETAETPAVPTMTPGRSLSATPIPTPTAAPTHTSVPTTAPTATPVIPTATPIPGPQEPPRLPLLAAVMGGLGGGGGGEPLPPKIQFVLETALPESPGQMTAYVQRDPEPVTVEYARQMAERLGVDGEVYGTLGMAAAARNADKERPMGDVGLQHYVVIERPWQEVYFEGRESFFYRDGERQPFHGVHWYPPQGLPPLEQALEAARAFLQSAGLLEEPYQVVYSGDTILFYHLLDARWMVSQPFAVVSIWPDGQVGSMSYRGLNLQDVGTYPIRPAQEAWEIVRSEQPGGRVLYARGADFPGWGEWQRGDPPSWGRAYRVGQRADLFGVPNVWFPLELEGVPYVTMNDLVLTGDLQALAQHILVQFTQDARPTMHVWGQVRDASGYLALQVEGWEETAEEFWSGTIQRQGGHGAPPRQGLLVTADGQALYMPDLPADLPDGTPVYVDGGRVGDTLEWYAIQGHPADEGLEPYPGGAQPTETLAAVEQVDLIYLVLALDHIPPEFTADWGYRALQPVWRFSGHTAQGTAFEVYVQAVQDAYLSD